MKILLFIILLVPASVFSQDKHPLTVDDLWAMKRIGSFDLSPDNKEIVFDETTYSMEKNEGNSDIYLINIDGSNLRSFKNFDKNETNPKFLPDGRKISYIIDDQIHICDLDGSHDAQLTDLYTGIDDYKWSHNFKKILLTSNVYPDYGSQSCNKKVDKEKKES